MEKNELSSGKETKMNVGDGERVVSAVAGGALLYYGIKRRSWLGALIALGGGNLLLRGTLGRSLIYSALGINTRKAKRDAKETITLEKIVFIDRQPDEVYRFWRNLENLPRIMDHVRAVRNIDDRRSHWVAKAPAGLEVEWDAEITTDQENRKIAWRSLEGAEVRNEGSVTFIPTADGRGTELAVYLEYQPPAGKLGKAVAELFGTDPARQIQEDLNRFKNMMETGEVQLAR